jgi:hypothetical protein
MATGDALECSSSSTARSACHSRIPAFNAPGRKARLFIPNRKNRWELIQQQRLPEYRRGQTNKMLNRFHKPCFDTALNT